MADVKVGSARIDENGNATGGKAGDQKNGKEVSTQSWYEHEKGWRVFRAIDPVKAEKIGQAMIDACANDNIGYDQGDRYDLFQEARKVGFDLAAVSVATECDCSELVRCCCAAAGIMDLPTSGFRTGNMPDNLMKTGEFMELTGDKYCKSPDYLGKGDILVTKKSGHTVVVLNYGGKYEREIVPDKDMLTVKGYNWNVRVGPGTDYKSVGQLDNGDQVKRLDLSEWIPVLYKGEVRYMHKTAFAEV